MSAYFIAQIKIHDREKYQRYLDGADAILARHAGEVLVVADSPTILGGKWPYTRTVVLRFRTEKDANRWYDSPEYQDLVRHRHQAPEADIVLVQGRDWPVPPKNENASRWDWRHTPDTAKFDVAADGAGSG